MAEMRTLYKLIVLKMLEQTDAPLSFSRISEFILGKGYTDYFSLQQALAEMVQTGHVTALKNANTTRYRVTSAGKHTLDVLGGKVADPILQDIQEYLKDCQQKIQNELSIAADYYPGNNGDYLARCQVREQDAVLIDLTLSAPTESQASSICANWKNKSQEIYAYVMKELL